MIGDVNDETDFSRKLLLTNTKVSRLHKALVNNSSTNIKLSKIQLPKMVQLGRFIPLFDKIMRPAFRFAVQAQESFNNAKD